MTSFFTLVFIFMISLAFIYTFIIKNANVRVTFVYVMMNIWLIFWAEILLALWNLRIPYPGLMIYTIYICIGVAFYLFRWIELIV